MKFELEFVENEIEFETEFFATDQSFDTEFGAIQKSVEYVGGELYEGTYMVTPTTEQQTLPTKERVMVEDVTVKKIPFFCTSNTSGGNTVYIGNEV